jgi:hypothetical protein
MLLGRPISEFVDYFWLFEGGQTARKERIVPSGTSELVINLRDDEVRIHDRNATSRSISGFRVRFCRELIRALFVIDAMQHESMLGVHFKPGGAFPFLGALASELTDAHADLADLWGQSALELRERLCTVSSHRNGFKSWKRRSPAACVALEKATPQYRLHCTCWDRPGQAPRSEMSPERLVYASGASARCSLLKLACLRKLFSRILRFERARALADQIKTT